MLDKNRKVSLIIAVYKDVEALKLIMDALRYQTYTDFEVVIAEDGENTQMREYIESIKDFNIKHTTQEDLGIRKTRSLNNGIIASSGDFLIFIDGDCVPYSTFVESYVKLAEDGYVLSGRRMNLGPKYSKKLRDRELSTLTLEKTFLFRYLFIAKDAIERHSEDGFRVSPDGWIYKTFIKNRKASTSILGCNYACFKKDIVEINGYDEAYRDTAVGDDTDLEWRFKAIGLKLKSAKYVANVFHLYHPRSIREKISSDWALELMEEKKRSKQFKCEQGIDRH
ncbi:MAG: glycosyltransferase [Sulfurimonas sp.]|uniref:glycosyltransferase n=1 Tax=Sulfurimonas sp. TaxID=2022749 RepID=UPI0025E46A68|nr:glycosyltransferase [Sulfurimonas sp.]MCK9455055.1 glycosyltransferase [Sulfurimonas sp.]